MRYISDGTTVCGKEYIRYWSPEWLKSKGEKQFFVIGGKVYLDGSSSFAGAINVYGLTWVWPAGPQTNERLLAEAMEKKEEHDMSLKARKEKLDKLKASRKQRDEAKERSRTRRLNMPWAAPTELHGVYKLTGLDGLWRKTEQNERGEVTAIHFRKPTDDERWRLSLSKIKNILRGREERFIRLTEMELHQILMGHVGTGA
jgi:hypothetical protein